MAKSYDNQPDPPAKTPPGPKKAAPAPNSRLADVQKRAQTMANRKPVSPSVFFQEAWRELKLTKWPDRPTLVKSTTVVLALVVSVAIWVGGLDFVLSQIDHDLHIFSVKSVTGR